MRAINSTFRLVLTNYNPGHAHERLRECVWPIAQFVSNSMFPNLAQNRTISVSTMASSTYWNPRCSYGAHMVHICSYGAHMVHIEYARSLRFGKNLSKAPVGVDFRNSRCDQFSILFQLIFRSFARSLAPSIARSIVRLLARSIAPSFAPTIARSLPRSLP